MSVQILPPASWIEFRGQPASGQNKSNHLAIIRDKSGKQRKCFVKLVDGASLLAEALGWLLAKEAGVRCSPYAAVLLAPLDRIRKAMSLPPEFDGHSQWHAWCSEIVHGNAVMQITKWATEVEGKTCLLSKDARTIAAFDEWSDLRDRNYGNVIKTKPGIYVSIDHETFLHDVISLAAGRRFQRRSLLDSAESALDPGQIKQFKLDMRDAAAGHAAALHAAKGGMDTTINRLYSPVDAATISQRVHAELDSRSQQGWMANRLQVIP